MESIPSNNYYTTFNTTQKYSTTILEIFTIFVSSTHLELNELKDFINKEISARSSHNIVAQNAIEQLLEHTFNSNNNPPPEALNSNFIDVMAAMIPLIDQYASLKRKADIAFPIIHHSNAEIMHQPTDNAHHPYVFKVPRKGTVFDKHWQEHFTELQDFKERFGHCNVSRTTKGYDQLGNWLADQRKKLRRGKMTQQQYELLTQLGVEWDRSSHFVANSKK